jgi:hypothetical protein
VSPKEIVDALEARLGVTGQPCQLRDAIELELLQTGKLPQATAAELSDRVLHKVAAEIKARAAVKVDTGDWAVLDVRGKPDTSVHGASYVFGDDSAAVQSLKKTRALSEDLRKAIIALDFSDFEKFGAKVLGEIGTKISKYTRHAGDQGIDFYGEVTMGHAVGADPATQRLLHETRLVIVGQAKHYPNRVIGPAIVRELVGALALSQTATFSSDIDLLDGVELKPFTPVLAMLFTTGDFTKGARVLAKRAGLVTFSGTQLSVFLADRAVGMVDVGGQLIFNLAEFTGWLHK